MKENLQVIPGRFLWEEKHRAPFIESLNSPDSRQKINDFISSANVKLLNINDIDNATETVTNIIIGAAEKTLKKKSQERNSTLALAAIFWTTFKS